MNMKKLLRSGVLLTALLFSGTGCAGNWSPSAGLEMQGENVFVWTGKRLRGTTAAADAVPLRPEKLVHARISLRIRKSSPGFRFDPQIRYLDSEGKLLNGTAGFQEALPRVNEPEIVDYEEYFTRPVKAAKAVPQLFFYGNAGEVELVSCSIAAIPVKPRSEPMKYPRFTNPERLSDQELDARLAELPVSRAGIIRRGDYNSIEVNGKELASPIFFTTGYNHMRYNMVRAYYDAGIRIFSVAAVLGVGRPNQQPSDLWQGPDKYDFAPLRQELRKLLREAPDAKILLNLSISPYRGYGTRHPDELYRAYNRQFGKFFHGYMRGTSPEVIELAKGKDGVYTPPSNCSVHFRREAGKAIRELCAAVDSFPEGKAVIAVYLNGGVDGQWFDQFNSTVSLTADYSPAAVSAFRNYLKMKYGGDPERLKKAWRDPSASFETAAVPAHEELWLRDRSFHTLYQTSSRCSDYCEFLGWNRAVQQVEWCDAVKAGSKGRWLAGSYYSNSGLRGFPQLGLQSVRYLLDAPSVDLFVLIPNYLRNMYEPVHQGGYNGSLVRHGKLIITELDLRNGELPYWGRWGTAFWRSHNPAERFQIDASRFAVSSLEKGGMYHMYDMEGGCFNSAASVEAWRKAAALLAQRSPQPLTRKHLGIVASEKFWCYQSFGHDRITAYTVRETPLHALYKAGVRHAVYLPEDLLEPDFDAPQVLVFLDAGTLNLEQIRQIRKKYARDGRVLVWMWQPGMFTDQGGEHLSEAAGFRLTRAPHADYQPLYADGVSTDPLMKNVRGFLFPYTPAYLHGWGTAWRVEDSGAQILARYYGTDIPGMAVRRTPEYTEVWCGAPGSLTPQLCRNLAEEGGVPVFLDSDDFCGTGAGLLYVSAVRAGEKNISLPDGFTGCTALTGQKFTLKDRQVSLPMSAGELLILKLLK